MTSSELRKLFLDFFKKHGHIIIPSASLIPKNDSSTLFIGSGMQPLVAYLLGQTHSGGKRLTDSQKSFRTEDIDEVGDGRHTTFFEMLGNWSLGDYFKKEQLPWVFEFLVEDLKLDPKRLYATVFRGDEAIGVPKDTESTEILKKVFKKYKIEAKDADLPEEKGMQDSRIFYYPAQKNWWSRSGGPDKMPIGEIGGPDSEIFYDLGADLKKHENSKFKNEPCHVNCDCGRFIEIGNSVFIEYKKTEKGFEKLEQYNVDFGGGLERMTMVKQGLNNIFEIDLFKDIIKEIEKLSGKKYRDNPRAFEVIADHLKAAAFILTERVEPSNIGHGYVLRRLIRKAIRYGKQLGIEEIFTHKISPVVANIYKDIYPEVLENLKFIKEELKKEEEKFKETLKSGIKRIEKFIGEEGDNYFERKNYNTLLVHSHKYGDLARVVFDLYQSYGFPIELTIEEFKNLKIENIDECKLKELFNQKIKEHQDLSRVASAGTFRGGLADASLQTTKYHTTTHLLLASLRQVLGGHVFQKGSNITIERLRFDFSHPQKMTPEEIKKTEDLVNQKIKEGLTVKREEKSLEEAKKEGAMGVFGEKYGDRVKVYTVFNEKTGEVFSKEICGGPHISLTSELGKFEILKEESSSAGVRRIKAVLE